MSESGINIVAIIGAGNMGHAIGQVFAQFGFHVVLHDRSQDQLKKVKPQIRQNLEELVSYGIFQSSQIEATLNRIEINDSLEKSTSNADLVIESVFEDRELKKNVFKELDHLCPKHTILASNTSEIIPSTFATVTNRPDKILATHFFYPAYLIPLVEIVPTYETSKKTIELVCQLLKNTGKEPIILKKEVPGFIANRLQVALLREALNMVERGFATPQQIDEAVKHSFGRRLGILGIFEIISLQGGSWDIDECLLNDISSSTVNTPISQHMKESYKMTSEEKNALRNKLVSRLSQYQRNEY